MIATGSAAMNASDPGRGGKRGADYRGGPSSGKTRRDRYAGLHRFARRAKVPKQRSRPAPETKRSVQAGAGRRGPLAASPGETMPATLLEARLAAEVDRLERELSAARAQI